MRTQVGVYTTVLAGLSRADLRACQGWGYVIAVETHTIAIGRFPSPRAADR